MQLGSGRLLQRAWPVAPEPMARHDSCTLQSVTAEGESMARVLPPTLVAPLKQSRSRSRASASTRAAHPSQQPPPQPGALPYLLKPEPAAEKQWAAASTRRDAELNQLTREADAWRRGVSSAQGTDV